MNKPTENIIRLAPDDLPLEFFPGETLAQTLSRQGFPLNQPCGGRGKCGKCRVLTQNGAQPLPQEAAVFSSEELEAGWRLACRTPSQPGLRLSLPGKESQGMRILGGETASAPAPTDGTAPPAGGYQLACDIGTTTVVLYLLHPITGQVLHTASSLNGQISFGGDVISRIFAVCEDYEQLAVLQQAIIDTINRLLERLEQESGVSREQMVGLSLAGNTTMEHLLLAADPRGMGKSPFIPSFLAAPQLTAAELRLALPPQTPIRLIPNLSAFVGGDITAGIYYTGMAQKPELSLLLDIGTNNEMVIGNQDGLFACSAAAGPALEGAQISTGMRAAAGAVEKAALDQGRLCLQTIDDAPPRGLCGSGLIDLLALLVRSGVVRSDGRFASPDSLPEGDLRSRLRPGGKRHQEFVYCRNGELGAEQDLCLTQKDVREAQLAKSAIAVGIDKLLERMQATPDDLKKVYLAGAFGNYIDQHNARELGILPPVDDERIIPVRNSAGQGVCRSIFDPQAETAMARIAALCQPLNLAAEEDFQPRFLARLQLGL